MKNATTKIFKKSENNSCAVSIALLVLRVVGGAFMLTHGWGKLQMLLGGMGDQFPSVLGLGGTTSLVLAVSAEFLASILLIIGLATRLAAIPLLFTMLVAAFIVHSADPFAAKELALMYGTIYAVILFLGGGKFSVDSRLFNKE